MNEMLNRLGMNAKAAETEMRNLSTNKKNEVLLAVADKLVKDAQTLINANRLDVETVPVPCGGNGDHAKPANKRHGNVRHNSAA